ncbi:DUF742 domain-containing protein [Haloechinothrix salitolerans]|uniref:DUF742 domain-containing protein n=2 Tax=Haloechinothrix salitolerans TaxID=926830 RepID=A0ABW2BW80_9PSEU
MIKNTTVAEDTDVVSDVPDAVSDTPDGELSIGDTPESEGADKREEADAATSAAIEDAAAHADFIAQFPSTDPDAVDGDFSATDAHTQVEVTGADDNTTVTGIDDDSDAAAVATTDATDIAQPAELSEHAEAAPGEDAQGPVDDPFGGGADDESDVHRDDVVELVGAAPAATLDDETPAADAEADAEPEAKSDTEADAEADTGTEADASDATPVTDDGDSVARDDVATVPEPVPESAPESAPEPAALDQDVDGTDDPDESLDDTLDTDFDDEDASSWVRPYVWTGGRTETSLDFAVETLVSARQQVTGTEDALRDEHRRVLELCEQPRSVTEIAALLSVPLGVAKTLLGAMVEEDLVVVHRAGGSAAGPDLALMERVLRGLKKL